MNTTYINYSYEKVENSFASGEVNGSTNVGGLIGYAYRQCTISHSYLQAYIDVTNCYAIGKVIASGEAGGLIGQLANTYEGISTVTNSYWTPETTLQDNSKAGIRRSIQTMLYKSAYSTWDFTNIWNIEEGNTTAYLKNVQKPSEVNKENITYDAYEIVGEGTELNPYIITTPLQLQKLNENLESYYKLGANIDLTGRTWKQIGSDAYPFKGGLDGNGYTISNLTLEATGNNVGLFGYSSGKLKSIKLDSIYVKGIDKVGGLVRI